MENSTARRGPPVQESKVAPEGGPEAEPEGRGLLPENREQVLGEVFDLLAGQVKALDAEFRETWRVVGLCMNGPTKERLAGLALRVQAQCARTAGVMASILRSSASKDEKQGGSRRSERGSRKA